MSQLQHVSIDLETLGKGPQAMILSIGAVKFDPHSGVLGDTFHRIVDVEAPGGGIIDVSTVMWWMRQGEEARRRLFVERDPEITVPLPQALIDLSEWLGFNDDLPEGETHAPVHLWQRGDKDTQWLTSAYEGMGYKVPFAYWEVSDQRTLCRWAGVKLERVDTAHDALSDAIYQAECIGAAFSRLLL